MEYETSDLGVAAAIISLGINIERIDKEGSRSIFVFPDSPRVRTISEEFFRGLSVPAQRYNDTIRSLKAQILTVKR